MLLPKSILYAISIAATAANGYLLAFYDTASGNCAGEFLGSWSGGPEAGCRTDYVGIAQDVIVKSDRNGDHDDTVVFFSSNDCNDANVISTSQVGCITVDSSIAAYSSFKVVDGTTRGKRDSDEINGSLSAPKRANKSRRDDNASPIYHGEVFEHNNATYRWHQLSQTAWSGVLIDEWDDNIHVMNNNTMEIPNSTPGEDYDDKLPPS